MMGTQDRGEDIRLSVRKTILVCDDETDLLLMFRIHLESQYNVITVDSGKSCVDTILDCKNKNKEIDLLLLDYKLGDISGDVVARKIKEIADMKILLITAFELDNQIISELMQNRLIVDVVKKPVQLEKLSQKIKETIVN
jgi:response regulator RpfG family c-di-GMP phosphodiesterase